MEDETLTFGRRDALHGSLVWRNGYGTHGPVGKTWGDLSIFIGPSIVWGRVDEFGAIEHMTWSWIDLLEFLASAWPHLIRDQTCPVHIETHDEAAASLGDLRACAMRRWHGLPDSQADREDETLRDFLVVHDFAEALAGACPPQLILLRDGEQMRVETASESWIVSFTGTMSALDELGEAIAERIANLTDPRSANARRRWLSRETPSPQSDACEVSQRSPFASDQTGDIP